MDYRNTVLNAIKRKRQDILPTQIDYTPEMKEKIKILLGVDGQLLEDRLGNHIKYLFLDDRTDIDKQEGIQYDIWGVGWDLVLTEGFHIRHHPLADASDLRQYKIPAPEDKLLLNIVKVDPQEKAKYFMLFDQGWTLFERSWLLRGYENVLTDLFYREKEIEYLLDGITEFHIAVAKKVIETKNIDGVYTGDDFGTQRGLLMSPETWRKFFKKRYKKIWDVYKAKGLSVFHHSCGDLTSIIPDMIEIGLDVLSPVQPEAMDPLMLSERFGKKLTFFGGISTQKTLPFGTTEEVRKEVIERIKVLGNFNGYIISPSHEVTSDCSDENFLMLLATLSDYKKGRL